MTLVILLSLALAALVWLLRGARPASRRLAVAGLLLAFMPASVVVARALREVFPAAQQVPLAEMPGLSYLTRYPWGANLDLAAAQALCLTACAFLFASRLVLKKGES